MIPWLTFLKSKILLLIQSMVHVSPPPKKKTHRLPTRSTAQTRNDPSPLRGFSAPFAAPRRWGAGTWSAWRGTARAAAAACGPSAPRPRRSCGRRPSASPRSAWGPGAVRSRLSGSGAGDFRLGSFFGPFLGPFLGPRMDGRRRFSVGGLFGSPDGRIRDLVLEVFCWGLSRSPDGWVFSFGRFQAFSGCACAKSRLCGTWGLLKGRQAKLGKGVYPKVMITRKVYESTVLVSLVGSIWPFGPAKTCSSKMGVTTPKPPGKTRAMQTCHGPVETNSERCGTRSLLFSGYTCKPVFREPEVNPMPILVGALCRELYSPLCHPLKGTPQNFDKPHTGRNRPTHRTRPESQRAPSCIPRPPAPRRSSSNAFRTHRRKRLGRKDIHDAFVWMADLFCSVEPKGVVLLCLVGYPSVGWSRKNIQKQGQPPTQKGTEARKWPRQKAGRRQKVGSHFGIPPIGGLDRLEVLRGFPICQGFQTPNHQANKKSYLTRAEVVLLLGSGLATSPSPDGLQIQIQTIHPPRVAWGKTERKKNDASHIQSAPPSAAALPPCPRRGPQTWPRPGRGESRETSGPQRPREAVFESP